MIRQLFSEENVNKAGIKIEAAYMSCPKDTAADHKGFFTIEAGDPPAVTKFFGPMTVEVRPVQPLSEVAKDTLGLDGINFLFLCIRRQIGRVIFQCSV
jgi:hypothetical protein